jgi:hypothetical protein
VNNMKANVIVLPYDDHDRVVKLMYSLDSTCRAQRLRPFWCQTHMRPL